MENNIEGNSVNQDILAGKWLQMRGDLKSSRQLAGRSQNYRFVYSKSGRSFRKCPILVMFCF
jgi:hypothetical protein